MAVPEKNSAKQTLKYITPRCSRGQRARQGVESFIVHRPSPFMQPRIAATGTDAIDDLVT